MTGGGLQPAAAGKQELIQRVRAALNRLHAAQAAPPVTQYEFSRHGGRWFALQYPPCSPQDAVTIAAARGLWCRSVATTLLYRPDSAVRE